MHGVPREIVSDKNTRLTSSFWKSVSRELGMDLGSAQPIIYRLTPNLEKNIHIMEDLLRLCLMDFGGSWEEHLPLVEFTYKTNYQASIKMAPFEALYGRSCKFLTCWLEGLSHR